ncbi:hypothetical protein KIL84_010152 [Mauremys mutica]|uniref:Uncharacterized protein n=1 Tax=Mauremys mutica TaxID=74926 RepID=A0A9D4B5R9_9SAUR|nr:hypothetical protein KIL84_010152 [Mauremys mutica]
MCVCPGESQPGSVTRALSVKCLRKILRASQQQRYHGPEGTPPDTAASLAGHVAGSGQGGDALREVPEAARRLPKDCRPGRQDLLQPVALGHHLASLQVHQHLHPCQRHQHHQHLRLWEDPSEWEPARQQSLLRPHHLPAAGGGSQTPPCNYNGGTCTQRIRIACVGGLLVHYEKSI